jgi:hypothetical protein
MKEAIAGIFSFFRDDFFPNLGYYLLQIFLIVLVVMLFAGINIAVRFITDPICTKVLRMREDKRWPSMIGLFFSAIITAILLIWSYAHVPQMRPTVIGWAGKQLQTLVTWDKLPDLEKPAAYEPAPFKPKAPGAKPEGPGAAGVKPPAEPTPAQPAAPPGAGSPSPPAAPPGADRPSTP